MPLPAALDVVVSGASGEDMSGALAEAEAILDE
jgi:hypothetical protein